VKNVSVAFGDVLRSFRNRRGFSQESLAFEAGMHRTYISQLERGLKSPTLDTMFKLADALGVRPTELLQLTEELTKRRTR
jgi:transcriptional regulator with XRE-family HTH domain